MKILITGVAGFIGYHLAKKLIGKSNEVIGIDNINSYYDIKLKLDRLKQLELFSKRMNLSWEFKKCDISDDNTIRNIFKERKPQIIINLAAQAGVRYSLENPKKYIDTNVNGFYNILENMRKNNIKKIIYASSSSVYGNSKNFPLNEKMHTSKQISLYGSTKKYNEILAHYYFDMFKISSYGLRFFTAYGPWGRPDMSIFKFNKNILLGKKIEVYNHGKHLRDFTFVDDIISCVFRLSKKIKNKEYKIINIAGGKTVKLMKLINLIEKNLNKKAKIKFLSIQKGDVVKTHASTKFLRQNIGFIPQTKIEKGIKIFCDWFLKEKNFLLKIKE